MYLDYAENQAARQVPMRMADWAAKLDAFLKFNEYEVLTTAGLVSAEVPNDSPKSNTPSFASDKIRRLKAILRRRLCESSRQKARRKTANSQFRITASW